MTPRNQDRLVDILIFEATMKALPLSNENNQDHCPTNRVNNEPHSYTDYLVKALAFFLEQRSVDDRGVFVEQNHHYHLKVVGLVKVKVRKPSNDVVVVTVMFLSAVSAVSGRKELVVLFYPVVLHDE